jgi:hypothetical protein
MRITLRPDGSDDALESHRPKAPIDWELVTMGTWSQSPYHRGAIMYLLANPHPGKWLLQSGEWSDEDNEFNDATDYDRIVAIAEDVPAEHTASQVAGILLRRLDRIQAGQGHHGARTRRPARSRPPGESLDFPPQSSRRRHPPAGRHRPSDYSLSSITGSEPTFFKHDPAAFL